jgi:thioredoxin-like negative regulator of GroEL
MVSVVSSPASGKKLAIKIKNNQPVLILIHADWCPHCVDYVGHPRTPLDPWQQVCGHIDRTFQGQVEPWEVESNAMRYLPPDFPPIQGFPTLVLLNGKVQKEFAGDRRDKHAITEFLKKELKPTVKPAAKPAVKQVKPLAKPAKPAVKPAKKRT